MTAASLDIALTRSAVEGGLRDLQAAWRVRETRISLPGMGGFAASPSLGNKIRGAFGEVLKESASSAVRRRQPCDWPDPCASEVFFGRRPLVDIGKHRSEIGKPYVLSTRARADGSLLVSLRIFGLACELLPAASEALVAALRLRVRWRDMTRDGPRFLPARIEPVMMAIRVPRIRPLPADPPVAAEMTFLSPLDAERGNPARAPGVIIDRLLRRLALMAPWQGVSLATAFDSVAAAACTITLEADEETSVAAPRRGGHHMANRLSPALRLRLAGDLAPLWPALALGEQVHVGRGASLGLGRYRLNGSPPDSASTNGPPW